MNGRIWRCQPLYMVVGDGCRDEEVGKEMDVVQAAEAYFKKFEIKSLLTQILIKLGEEQPDDPAAAIRAHLEVSTLPMVGKSVPISDSVLLAADEEHDADDSLFQARFRSVGPVWFVLFVF